MAQKVAGNIVIRLTASGDQFAQDMRKAGESTRNFGVLARAVGPDVKSAAIEMRNASRDAAEFAAALLIGTKAIAAQVTATSALEGALNRLRAARVGMAAFTSGLGGAAVAGAEIAAVVAIEKIAKSTYDRAKEIQQTTLASQKTGFSYQDTSALSFAAQRVDKPADFFDSAVKSAGGVQQLADKLKELGEIQDPVARADAAFKTFGADTEKLLPLIGERFSENIKLAQDWGFTLDEVSRDKVDGFNRDMKALKGVFDGLGDSIAASKQDFLSLLQIDFAGIYDILIGGTGMGIGAVRGAIGNVTDDPMASFKGITKGAQTSVQSRNSQDMLAQAQKEMLASLTAPGEKSFQKDFFDKDQEAGLRAEIEELQKKLFVSDRTSADFGKLGSGAQFPGGYGAQAEALQKYTSDKGQLKRVMEAKDADTAAKKAAEEASQAQRTISDAVKGLDAELAGVQAKLAAIGQGAAGEALAKSFAAGQKAIAEVNKELEKDHTQLPKFVGPRQPGTKPADWDKEGQILYREALIGTTEAEATWQEKLKTGTQEVDDRIRQQELLTAAIGKGYEATKKATVDAGAISFLGKEYNNPDWLGSGSPMDTADQKSHRAALDAHNEQTGKEFDAQHGEGVGNALQSLKLQIDLQKALAAAQKDGAEAVRQVTLAYDLQRIALDNDAASTKKLQQAAVDKYNAERANEAAGELDKINQETAATERLTAAVFKGAEAARLANLENKYVEMGHAGATPEVISATRTQDAAAHQEQLSSEAATLATHYSDALTRISQLTEKLKEAKATQGDTIGIEIALRDLENERLQILADQSLKLGGLKDGVRAFFLEMQEDARAAATAINQAMHSALESVSSQLAKLVTGQKTSWAKMFQGLGTSMVESSIKTTLQAGLGKLGKPAGGTGGTQGTLGKIGSALGLGTGVGKPDGSTAANALWVRMADAQGSPIQNNGAPGTLPGVSKKGSPTFGNGGLLGTGGVPTAGVGPGGADGKPDGSESNPVGVTLAPNGSGPDGTEGNPFYVSISQDGGFQNAPINLGPNEKPPATPNFLQQNGQQIGKMLGAIPGILEQKKEGTAGSPGVMGTGQQFPNTGGTGSPAIAPYDPTNSPFFMGHDPGPIIKDQYGFRVRPENIPPPASSPDTPPSQPGDPCMGGFQNNPIDFPNQKAAPTQQPAWMKWLEFGLGVAGSVFGGLGGFGGGGGGATPDVTSSVSYPGLATGGPVKTGKHYIVGERGPELFRSGTAGHIIDHETTKRMARFGMLPPGIKVPGVSVPSPVSRATAAPKRLTPRADGGDVSAGDSYITGERGPELFTSGAFSSDQGSRRTPGNGGNAYYSIDARGTDPVLTEQRVKAALVAVHGSAVSTSIQGVDERAKRTPQRS